MEALRIIAGFVAAGAIVQVVKWVIAVMNAP
jgi:hypothetical protein